MSPFQEDCPQCPKPLPLRPVSACSMTATVEARSLLYNAYRHEPTFAYIFEAQRPGYERRLRVMVREWVRQHFYLQLPAIGLLVEDRLIAMA